MVDMNITSNASWTKISDSRDNHVTVAAAQAVCDMLLSDYGTHTPCEIRGVCTDAWVEIDGVRQA